MRGGEERAVQSTILQPPPLFSLFLHGICAKCETTNKNAGKIGLHGWNIIISANKKNATENRWKAVGDECHEGGKRGGGGGFPTLPSIIHYVLKISAEKCGQMIIIIVVIALWEGGHK